MYGSEEGRAHIALTWARLQLSLLTRFTEEHQIPWGLCCHWDGFRFLIGRSNSEPRIPLLELVSEGAVEDAGPGLEHEVGPTLRQAPADALVKAFTDDRV